MSYIVCLTFLHRDRVRTTNNMLGDCYAAAVVEHLSKKELMALDALYQDTPNTPNGHVPSSPRSETNSKDSVNLEMGRAGYIINNEINKK